MQTIVIGHKNPDMDSICSAIGYARLKALQGVPDVIPARAGNTNKRIDYVLHKFGVQAPMFLTDLSPRVEDVMERRVIALPFDSPVYQAINVIEQNKLRGLPVTDADGRCLGLLSAFKVSQYLFPLREDIRRARLARAPLRTLVESFGGRLLAGKADEEVREYRLVVAAMSAEELARRMKKYDPETVVLCVGDRDEIHAMAIERRVRAIVVSGALPVPAATLQAARAAGVVMISSAFDTASTVLLARGSVSVEEMLDRDFVHFTPDTPLEVARSTASSSRWATFPVLDSGGSLVGIMSKSDFLKDVPRQLILVDHNELSQAVDGAACVPIVEILDHHRLGGYSTRGPIHFWNNPVGSTSTIVALCYGQAGIPVPQDIAGLLLAGLISDTLNLSSPTATQTDARVREELAKAAKVDPDALAQEIFAVGSPLLELTPEEVVLADAKEYDEEGERFMVSQIEELGLAELSKRQAMLVEALEQEVRQRRLTFAALLVTDITRQHSVLLAAGDRRILSAIDYPSAGQDMWEMDGVVSRKKQLLPYLLQVLKAAHARR